MTKRSTLIYLLAIALALAGVVAWYASSFRAQQAGSSGFDGDRALADVKTQVAFGPRIPGEPGHARVEAWIKSELEAAGWTVQIQSGEEAGHPVDNIVARRGDSAPDIIVGAHYDSRIYADRDPDPSLRDQPMPGANDGASGVAVLLGLARSLPKDTRPVWLVFFDSEDNGEIGTWDWILGSRLFVAQNPVSPRAVFVVDMVGDANLNIYWEYNSNVALRTELWKTAAQLGYSDVFIPQVKYTMLDDHTPFLDAGLPAVDIIDFDYPYFHTTQDTPDKVSARSLDAVGDTLQAWIVAQGH